MPVLRSLLLLLLLLPPPALSSRGQCVDETCSYDLQEYHSQMVNLPSHVHERSIAPWSYVQNIDLNRVPQVIQEASCHTSHSCRALEDLHFCFHLLTILKAPVSNKLTPCSNTVPSSKTHLELCFVSFTHVLVTLYY
uniref:Uncharacterized protein n=1 Tax=Periophthalmus magnuspinnatus TaxID=409849 RepID=A0A3B4AQH5_9GOBI